MLKGMEATKVPGYDGFLTIFFKRYWHIIEIDVLSYSLRVLNHDYSPYIANRNEIVLIPKIQIPMNLTNFKPISLCSIPYKIIAKTMANRLYHVIVKCIDSAQGTFIPNRLILITYELLHSLKMKRYDRNGVMALKLKMSKAYDKVN